MGSEKKEEVDSEEQVKRLINIGLSLDLPTENEGYWERDKETGEVLWKAPERDVRIEQHLKIRTKKSGLTRFTLNRAQREYSGGAPIRTSY